MKITTFLLTILFTASVAAEPVNWGFYAGAGYGIQEDSTDDTDLARVYMGYKVNKHFTIETGWTNYFLDDEGPIDFEAQAFDVSTLLTVPLHRRVELFGRIGYHFSRLTAEFGGQDETLNYDGLVYGAGVVLRPMNRLDVKAEYVVYRHDQLFDDSTTRIELSATWYISEFGHDAK